MWSSAPLGGTFPRQDWGGWRAANLRPPTADRPGLRRLGGAPPRNQANRGRAFDIPSARDVRRRHARLEATMPPNEYEILV